MVQGFERAQQEYEYKMMCPYDKGGALYDEEEEENYQPYDTWEEYWGEK